MSELNINGNIGTYVSDVLKASFTVTKVNPVIKSREVIDDFIQQVGEFNRLSAFNLSDAEEKPKNYFEAIKAYTDMLVDISKAMQGWTFAYMNSRDPLLHAWLDAGFIPVECTESKRGDGSKIFILFKRCGTAEKVDAFVENKTSQYYKAKDARVVMSVGEMSPKDLPAEVIGESHTMWNYFGDIIMLEGVEVESTRRSPIFKNDILREFLVQAGFQWPERLVCIPIDKKDKLRFISAVDAGYVPVNIYQDSYIFVKSMSWFDFGSKK